MFQGADKMSGMPSQYQSDIDWKAVLAPIETPAYFYDTSVVKDNFDRLKSLVGTPLRASFKANGDEETFNAVSHLFTDGVEVASVGELDFLVSRFKGRIIVNTPGMSVPLIRRALAIGATLIFDSFSAARTCFENTAPEQRRRSNFGLRLNAHALGSEKKDFLGMSLKDAQQVAELIKASGHTVSVLQLFSGSFSFADRNWLFLERLADLARTLHAQGLGDDIELAFGGGFSCADIDATPLWQKYMAALQPYRSKFRLSHEAGRAIFETAGWFAVRVIAVKRLSNAIVVVADGGLQQNFLLAKTEQRIKLRAEPQLVAMGPSTCELADLTIRVIGPSCHQQDIIGVMNAGMLMPRVGDVLLFPNCGAYNESYSPKSFLKSQPAGVHVR